MFVITWNLYSSLFLKTLTISHHIVFKQLKYTYQIDFFHAARELSCKGAFMVASEAEDPSRNGTLWTALLVNGGGGA